MNKISQKPDFLHENRLSGRICGVDEAGRGPLAGPVVAAAVVLSRENYPDGLNDSKKLSDKKRAALYERILICADIGIGIAEPEEIDRVNILSATMNAMARAVAALNHTPDHALIDGNRPPVLPLPATPIVKGDEKSLSIAAASIIAKVTRDRIMCAADQRFSVYGFSSHKGYPSPTHKQALLKYGPCPIHRFSYRPVKAVLTSPNKSLKT